MVKIFKLFNKPKKHKEELFLTREKKLFDYLYKNLILEDFVYFIRENIVNIDCENYVYNELTFDNVIEVVDNAIFESLSSDTKILNIASGAGQLIFMLNFMYNFKVLCGLENIFEMYSLSKELLDKYKKNSLYDRKKENITFIMNDPLLIDFSHFNVIIIGYNNSSKVFESMLQEKIKQECKRDTIIVKFISRFREDEKIRIFKKISLKNKKNREFFVYFYELKS